MMVWMKWLAGMTGLVCLLCMQAGQEPEQGKEVKVYFSRHAALFAASARQLQNNINNLNPTRSEALAACKTSLRNCRLAYKRIEFFLEYFIPQTARPFNLPPVYEIE